MSEVYVCEQDVKVVADGSRLMGAKDESGILFAAKGKRIPVADAIRLGLIEDGKKAEEGEADDDIKASIKSRGKAADKAENKKAKKGEDK